MPKIVVEGKTQEELMDTIINLGVAQLQMKNMHIDAKREADAQRLKEQHKAFGKAQPPEPKPVKGGDKK